MNLDFSDSSGIMGYMDGEPEMFETETMKKIVQQFYKRFSADKDGMCHGLNEVVTRVESIGGFQLQFSHG